MLIADDILSNDEKIWELFENKYSISKTKSGEEVLNILSKNPNEFDVILLDFNLPDMCGIDVMTKIKEIKGYNNAPIVIISTNKSKQEELTALKQGASEYFTAPFYSDIIVSRIEKILRAKNIMSTIKTEAEEFKVKSQTDLMTGLYNKITAENMISQALNFKKEELNALMIIDIDNFKYINDVSGHSAGDKAICFIASIIMDNFRKTDIKGRFGGDEFIILMNSVPSKQFVLNKISTLINQIKVESKFLLEQPVSVSVGVSFNDNANGTYEALFNEADEALRHSKKIGSSHFAEYGNEFANNLISKNNAVLLYTRNRNVSCAVNAVANEMINIIENKSINELVSLKSDVYQKISFALLDISNEEHYGKSFWENIKDLEWFKKIPVLSICEESNIEQLKTAVNSGVKDVLTVPLDICQLKRCVFRQLNQNEN